MGRHAIIDTHLMEGIQMAETARSKRTEVMTDGSTNFYAVGANCWAWHNNPVTAIENVFGSWGKPKEYMDGFEPKVEVWVTNAERLDMAMISSEDLEKYPHWKTIRLGEFEIESYRNKWRFSDAEKYKILNPLFLLSADTILNHFEMSDGWDDEGGEEQGVITRGYVLKSVYDNPDHRDIWYREEGVKVLEKCKELSDDELQQYCANAKTTQTCLGHKRGHRNRRLEEVYIDALDARGLELDETIEGVYNGPGSS